MTNIAATAEIEIAANPARVWRALTDPDQIKRYFFGSEVTTDWQPGSPITWSGEYNGTSYADKGKILQVEIDKRLVLTHSSAMSGQPDTPENYHTLSFELAQRGPGTHLTLTQDNNHDRDEAERSQANWQTMLVELKKVVEGA